MPVQSRKYLLVSLVLVFFVQTWFVWSDPAGRASPPLSEVAADGRDVWLRHNCQSCHQIYGFGGFLGPDLTNATERLTRARVDTVLTDGAGQMPAFHLDDDERRAVEQFLAEVHETGVGQLPPIRGFDAPAVLETAIAQITEAGTVLGLEAARGRDVLLAQKCLGCHLPNPVAEHKGTDLTQLVPKLGRGGVEGMLRTGIPSKGMPRFDLEPSTRADLLAFLTWLTANAAAVHAAFVEATPEASGPSGLPWFEYR